MTKLLIIMMTLTVTSISWAQKHNNQKTIYMSNTSVDKWVKAVVNIEARSSQTDPRLKKMQEDVTQNKAKYEDYDVMQQLLTPRYTGTAIYVKYKEKHFLVTARHVLEDTLEGEGKIYGSIFIIKNGTNLLTKNISEQAAVEDDISFMQINSIPNAFKFSSKEEDIAVINIDNVNPGMSARVKDKLRLRGNEPIEISDIYELDKVIAGTPIIAIGFPSLADIPDPLLPNSKFNFNSPRTSIPILTKGTIEDELSGKNFFYGNVFVYHGSSGGPIISNEKLIGIVHGAEPIHNKTNDSIKKSYDQLHLKFMKAFLIKPLLDATYSSLTEKILKKE